MVRATEACSQVSTRRVGLALAHDNLLAEPSRWGTLSWISAKALIDSVNHGLDRFSDGLVPQLRAALGAATRRGRRCGSSSGRTTPRS